MKTHSIIVFKSSGVPIYYKHITPELQSIDYNLFSSFLTAILQFSSQIVKQDLNIIEIGKYKLFIKKAGFDFTFVLVSDFNISNLLIQNQLKKFSERFFQIISEEDCRNLNYCVENTLIDAELKNFSTTFSNDNMVSIQEISKIIQNYADKEDLVGAALISSQGQVFYSSLKNEDLQLCLKDLELRSISQTTMFEDSQKIIYQYETKLFISQLFYSKRIHNVVSLVLLFDSTKTPIGMADMFLEDIMHSLQYHI